MTKMCSLQKPRNLAYISRRKNEFHIEANQREKPPAAPKSAGGPQVLGSPLKGVAVNPGKVATQFKSQQTASL